MIGGTFLTFQTLIQSSPADEAEERQRDVLHLGTFELLQKMKEGNEIPPVNGYQLFVKKMEQIGPLDAAKVAKMVQIQDQLAELTQNPLVDFNFGLTATKEMELGPYGLKGAGPIKVEYTEQTDAPREVGLWERIKSLFVDFVTGPLDTYNTPSTDDEFLAQKPIEDYVTGNRIKADVLKKFKKDTDDPYERAAIDELARLQDEKWALSTSFILDNLTENPVMKVNFYNAGTFSGAVEWAMSEEYTKSMGLWFEQIAVGNFKGSQVAVRKLMLETTSPFLEAQKQAYALYRYGID